MVNITDTKLIVRGCTSFLPHAFEAAGKSSARIAVSLAGDGLQMTGPVRLRAAAAPMGGTPVFRAPAVRFIPVPSIPVFVSVPGSTPGGPPV